MKKFLLAICLFLFVNLDVNAYKYQLAIASIFQNEAPYLKEWIEYHRYAGVEHFWLYNNDSTDNFQEVLQPYIEEGLVDLYYWPDEWPDIPWPFGCQTKCYQDAISKAKHVSKWLALIDIDEFILPSYSVSISLLLNSKYKDESGVVLYWKKFGTSNIPKLKSEKLMIEQLVLRAEESNPCNKWFKTILRPKHVKCMNNPHGAEYLTKDSVNTKYQPTNIHCQVGNFTCKAMHINHYWTRDIEYLINVKVPRCEIWNISSKKILDAALELNSEEDYKIIHYYKMMKHFYDLSKPSV